MSRDWAKDFYALSGVGEVWGTPREYNGRRALPGLLGEHHCGPDEWFQYGIPFDPERPPVQRDRDGLLECCNYSPPILGPYAGGNAPHAYTPPAPTFVLTGDAVDAVVRVNPYLYGNVATGDLADAQVVAGEVVTGDVGTGDLADALTAAGEMVTGDVGTGDLADALTAAGEMVMGDVGTGDLAAARFPYTEPVSGGVEIGGTIVDDYDPGVVVPGLDCATAGTLNFGAIVDLTIPASGGARWFKFPTTMGQPYSVRFLADTGASGWSMIVWSGACGHQSYVGDWNAGCDTRTGTGDMWYLQFSDSFFGDVVVRFQVTQTTC